MKLYENKNYLIVGASSGIGYSVAENLTEQGANVIIVSSQEEKLKIALKKLKYGKNLSFCYDLSDSHNVKDIFEFCYKNNIVLDGMIYSAGIAPLCLLKENNPVIMEKTFNINFFSFMESVRCFQEETYSLDRSKIVVITSITGKGAGYRQTLYGSSKAAVISSVKLMAKELLNRGIHINAVSPGVVATDMLNELEKESTNLMEKIRQNQVLGVIPANKVAEVVLFLLSNTADFLTGTEFIYDGGALLK